MQRWIALIALCCFTYPALSQSTSKYRIGTITEVKPHQSAGASATDATSFDVSVVVGDIAYVVLYTTPIGELAPKYAAGRELLVLVRKDTISYNDILGYPHEVPIESQRAVTDPKHTK